MGSHSAPSTLRWRRAVTVAGLSGLGVVAAAGSAFAGNMPDNDHDSGWSHGHDRDDCGCQGDRDGWKSDDGWKNDDHWRDDDKWRDDDDNWRDGDTWRDGDKWRGDDCGCADRDDHGDRWGHDGHRPGEKKWHPSDEQKKELLSSILG